MIIITGIFGNVIVVSAVSGFSASPTPKGKKGVSIFEQSVFFGVSAKALLRHRRGRKKVRFALFNPLLISVVLTILTLTAHISF